MRCLYCGKELALLKRWTGGGEFCSDAHRQQYQDEYNQLALNRLLQAKPPSEEKSPGTPAPAANQPEEKRAEETKKPEPPARPRVEPTAPVAAPPPPASPQPVSVSKPAVVSTPVVEHRPAARYSEPESAPVMVEEEEPAPAELGSFLVEIPVPAIPEVPEMATVEIGFEHDAQPALPQRDPDPWGTLLVGAGRVALTPSDRFRDWAAPRGERRLESREIGHSTPIIDFNLGVASETGLTKISEEPMDFLVFPHPPQGSPPLWQEAEKEFKFETELGVLARVTFGTTGLQDNAEDVTVPAVDDAPAAVPAASSKAPEANTLTADSTTTAPPPPTAVESAPAVPPAKESPRPIPSAAPAAGQSRTTFPRPPLIASKAPEQVAEKTQEQPKPKDKVPDLVKKPLPLTLHGLAAGRGKPVQIISAAASSGVELQVPRSTAVPMRPVMILGPAPAVSPKPEEKKPDEKRPERTVVIKSDPKKIQPARIDPRIVSSKGRKPEVRLPDFEKKEAEKREPEKKDSDKGFEKSADRSIEKTLEKSVQKTDVKPIAPASVPANEPAPRPAEAKKQTDIKLDPPLALKELPQVERYSQPDLGLPSLSFQDSGNFLTRLPMPAKIGVAVGVVLAIAGVIALGMKGGNGAAASAGPRVVAGPPIAAVASGWITDWGAEPGVRRQHEISILGPSMNLTDYRLEFEAQIETKAIGWVYRALDSKNYYVSKLEIVKPGLEPTIALVRFAVINGEEQPRSQFPLKIPVRIDTLYKIRFDAIGDHFTTWVLDQQVDDWTDDHIKRGGVGLYNERGEQMSLRGSVNVVPLVIKR
jgi:hypothetical protein